MKEFFPEWEPGTIVWCRFDGTRYIVKEDKGETINFYNSKWHLSTEPYILLTDKNPNGVVSKFFSWIWRALF